MSISIICTSQKYNQPNYWGTDCSHPLRSGVPGGAVRPSQRGICCHPQAAGLPCGSLRAIHLPMKNHEGGFPGTLFLRWNPAVPFLPARRLTDGSPSWRHFVAATVYRWLLEGTRLKAFRLLIKLDWLLGFCSGSLFDTHAGGHLLIERLQPLDFFLMHF